MQLRNGKLEEVRQAVRPLLEKLNRRPMRKLKKSRRDVFEEMERAALRPLPVRRYEYADWARPKVHVDYHIEKARGLKRTADAPLPEETRMLVEQALKKLNEMKRMRCTSPVFRVPDGRLMLSA